MRRSSRLNSLFSFVTRHSLIVIRLLLHRQLKLPILQKELSGHGTIFQFHISKPFYAADMGVYAIGISRHIY